MTLRTLAAAGLCLGLIGTAAAQSDVQMKEGAAASPGAARMKTTPAHYAEADLQRLAAAVEMKPEQLAACRRLLQESEKELAVQRAELRQQLEKLDMRLQRAYDQVARELAPDQAEALVLARKQGKLAATMDVAEPGSVSPGKDAGLRPQLKSEQKPERKPEPAQAKPTGKSTTLQR